MDATTDRTAASSATTSRRVRSVRALARLAPWDPVDDDELARALAFLDWPLTAPTVQRAGDGMAVVLTATLALPGLAIASATALAAAAAVGVLPAVGARYVPRLFATARRTRALGDAPGLVSRAVLRMRLSPTPETAAAFAADTGDGRLADSLSAHVHRGKGSGRSGLSTFADEWTDRFPALRRALTLVESAGRAPEGERRRALDNALSVTLDGTRDAMASFAASIRGPATALYAFGVLLPLALVALLPAAATVGIEAPALAIVVGYDLLLPAALVVASAWLLSRRPVAFPPPRIPRDHPDVPDRSTHAAFAGLSAAIVAGVTVRIAVEPWAAPLVALGAGPGTALAIVYRPATRVRDRVRDVEAGLADALYLVGREVQRGRAVETAIADAADALDSETGRVFADAARQQRQLRIGVREAFLGEHGALATVPSERARSTAELLALAATQGQPAGRAIVAMAEHLEDLRGIEREARRDLQRVVGTLGNTATVFAPLVGGATVTLAERMQTDGPLSGGLSPSVLGLAVGAYVLILAVVLTVLATGLERGFDRSLIGYRVGRALLVSVSVFLLGLVATDLLV